MTMSELLPCPFCGCDKILDGYIRDGREIVCGECRASVAAFHPDASKRAAERWNRRAADSQSSHERGVAELDEKTIVRLAWENFSESDYGRLTYERAPPMFPQAKYDVPTYALSQFVKAVRAAAPAKREGGE